MTYRSFVLALLAAGFYGAGEGFDWPLLRQIGVALAIVFVVAYLWSRINISGLSARRDAATTTLQVGSVFSESLAVRSSSIFPKLWVELRDRCEMPAHNASRVFSLKGRGAATWETQSVAVKRGVFRIGPIFLRSSDPFAIFSHERRVDFDEEITVMPPVFDLATFVLPGAESSGGRAVDRRTPFTTSAASSIRDYAAGDPFNRISWTSTARTGKLMVKEFDLDPSAEIWVLADFQARQSVLPVHERELSRNPDIPFSEAWFDSSDDFVAALAASVSRKAVDANRALGYLGNGARRELRPADSTERQFLRVLSLLAVARSDGVSSINMLLVEEMRRFDRYRSPVVITSSSDLDWIETLEHATLHGVRPIVIYVDPESFDPAVSSREVRERLATAPFASHVVDYRNGIEASFAWETQADAVRSYFNVN